MNTPPSTPRWIALLVTLSLFAGCKDKKPPPPPPVTQSPAAAPVAPSQPDPADDPVPPTPSAWPHQQPDTGPPPDLTAAAKPQPREAISTDADIARAKEEQELQDTQKAVERTVRGAIPSVKQCFDRADVSAGDYNLRVRVHRSGRVLSSSVPGVSSEVSRCVEKALSQLRVSGVKTDTIEVERQIKYTR